MTFSYQTPSPLMPQAQTAPVSGYIPFDASSLYGYNQPSTAMSTGIANGAPAMSFDASGSPVSSWSTSTGPQKLGFGGLLDKYGGSIGSILGGAGSLAQAFSAWKGLGIAKDQLRFQKDAYNQNMINSISSYNTALEDRIRGRTSEHAGKEAEVQAYLAAHNLTQSKKK